MQKFILLLCICVFLGITDDIQAQFNPQYPLPGNKAVHKDDPKIKSWAINCTVDRGWMNFKDTTLGKASGGVDLNGTGKADGKIVSLGDFGEALLTFDPPITNGDGADFLVFENAFQNPLNDSLAYLELAFVEVSSDGINFVRFPSESHIQTDSQADNFTYLYASQVHNLAGKYIANYSTPFDLDDLKDISGIDINKIKYVRIVDVAGIIDETYASKDAFGNTINDPWPSPYPNCGFDLDAVGVINKWPGSTDIDDPVMSALPITIYPNPAHDLLIINNDIGKILSVTIIDVMGNVVTTFDLDKNIELNVSEWPSGQYIVIVDEHLLAFIKR